MKQTKTGPRVPNLSQHTDDLNIHCDLVNSSLVDGDESDIIHSFSTVVLRPSYSFILETRRITCNPINKNVIGFIRIYLTDGKRRIIDLNRADTSFSLILKRLNYTFCCSLRENTHSIAWNGDQQRKDTFISSPVKLWFSIKLIATEFFSTPFNCWMAL